MIINECVLTELKQQRRAQVADNMAALRDTMDRRRRRISVFGRRKGTAPNAEPVPKTIALGTGSTAH